MSRYWINLFPLSVDWSGLTFYGYSVSIPNFEGKVRTLNRLRFALFNETKSPVFYKTTPEGALFFSFRPFKRESVELSADEVYPLNFEGETEPPPPDRHSLEFVIEDIIRLKNLIPAFQKKRLKEQRHPKYGKILIYPFPFVRVYKNDKFLLQVDFKFHLTTEKSIQQLFEEGSIEPQTVENNENFPVRPKGFERTAYIVEVIKAAKLKDREIENYFHISKQPETKRLWGQLLENPMYRKRIFVLKLSNGYVYPAPLVKPVLDFSNLEDVSSEILKTVKLNPPNRWKLIWEFVNAIAQPLKDYSINLSNRSEKIDEDYRVNYHREVVDAKGRKESVEKSLLPFLKNCTPFVKRATLKTNILVILDNKGREIYNRRRKEFIGELQGFLLQKGIELKIGTKIGIEASSRNIAIKKLAENIKRILEGNPDLVIVFTPEYGGVKDLFREITIYDYLKGRFLERGIASQFVLKKTLFLQKLEFVVYNVAEQIMGKTANVPYKLSESLEGVDVFIGIDISRTRKNNGGSVNEGAFTKIFFSDGSFLKYSLSSFPSMGEEVTLKAIQGLFLKLWEEGIKRGSTVVVHRDGNFRGKEVEIFTRLGEEFGYNLELVEVIKRNNPRFFGNDNNIKGLYYPLGEREAVVATYNNSHLYTHQPIKVRLIKGKLPLEKHISYILSFTLLNYSSFKPVKLPATTYHTDKMARMALRGLKPSKTEGEEMFWL